MCRIGSGFGWHLAGDAHIVRIKGTKYTYKAAFIAIFDRNGTLSECKTCTIDKHNNPGLRSIELVALLSKGSYMISSLLLRIGIPDPVWDYGSAPGALAVRDYSGMDKNEHFSNYLNKEGPIRNLALPHRPGYTLHTSPLVFLFLLFLELIYGCRR
ncbi:hypothetical protein PSPO01_13575 [Paraphaeosphaeria sporulosa]